jgi:hypothetical protein
MKNPSILAFKFKQIHAHNFIEIPWKDLNEPPSATMIGNLLGHCCMMASILYE